MFGFGRLGTTGSALLLGLGLGYLALGLGEPLAPGCRGIECTGQLLFNLTPSLPNFGQLFLSDLLHLRGNFAQCLTDLLRRLGQLLRRLFRLLRCLFRRGFGCLARILFGGVKLLCNLFDWLLGLLERLGCLGDGVLHAFGDLLRNLLNVLLFLAEFLGLLHFQSLLFGGLACLLGDLALSLCGPFQRSGSVGQLLDQRGQLFALEFVHGGLGFRAGAFDVAVGLLDRLATLLRLGEHFLCGFGDRFLGLFDAHLKCIGQFAVLRHLVKLLGHLLLLALRLSRLRFGHFRCLLLVLFDLFELVPRFHDVL